MQPSNITSGGGNRKGKVESKVVIERAVNPNSFSNVVEELKEKYNSQLLLLSDYDKHQLFYIELKQFFTSTINTLPSIQEITQVITQVNSTESFFQIPQFKDFLIYYVIDCLQVLQRDIHKESYSTRHLNIDPLNLANQLIDTFIREVEIIPNFLALVANAILLNIETAKKSDRWDLLLTAKNYLTKYNDNLEAEDLKELFNKLNEAFDKVPKVYKLDVNTEKYNLFLGLFSKLDDEARIKSTNSFFQLKDIKYSLDKVTVDRLMALYDKVVKSPPAENISLQNRIMAIVLKYIVELKETFEPYPLEKFIKNICNSKNDENQMYFVNMLINKLKKDPDSRILAYRIWIIKKVFVYSQSPQVVKIILNSSYIKNSSMVKYKYFNSSKELLNPIIEYNAKQNMIMPFNTKWVVHSELIEVKVFNLIESLIQNDETKINQPFAIIDSKIDTLIKDVTIKKKIKEQFSKYIVFYGFSCIRLNPDYIQPQPDQDVRKRKRDLENNNSIIDYVTQFIFEGLEVDSISLFSTIIKFLNNDNLQWNDKFLDVNSRWTAWLLGFNQDLIKNDLYVVGDFIKIAICQVNKFHPLISQVIYIYLYTQTIKENITNFILDHTDKIYEELLISEEGENVETDLLPDVNSESFLNQLKKLYLRQACCEDLHRVVLNTMQKMIETQTNPEFKFLLVKFGYDMIHWLNQKYKGLVNTLENLQTSDGKNLLEQIKQIIVNNNQCIYDKSTAILD